jgi:mannose-6-phosphate isomerase-like protein (cupin superfamily)
MACTKIRLMAYTKKNLKEDVQDAAPGFGFAPDMEARFASRDLELEQSGVGYERWAPNFRVPFGHTHKGQEEVYVVVSGSGRVKIDDEIVDFKQWDAIRVPAGVWRCFEAGDDGAEVIAFGAPKMDDPRADAEMQPGWWSDS